MLYTYLKRVTAFAAVPGAVIGAIPPVVGYVAAGGSPTDGRILLPAFLLGIWQVPHFWLLLLLIGEQYARAGLPTLTRVFAPLQLRRVTFMWVLAAAVAGAVFPVVMQGFIRLPWSLLIVAVSIWLGVGGATLLYPGRDERTAFRKVFIRINLFALIVVFCLVADALRLGQFL